MCVHTRLPSTESTWNAWLVIWKCDYRLSIDC